MTQQNQQYLRNISLLITDQNGKGLDLGQLRVVFQVRRGDTQTPNTCDCTVYNLSSDTANRLRGVGATPEFQYLRLSASYGPNPVAQVFAGTIKQVRIGREDARNSYVAITAAAGDQVYNYAPLAFTLAAGYTPEGVVKSLIAFGAASAQAMSNTAPFLSADQQIVEGYIPVPDFNNRSIRGRVYFGGWRDEMRDYVTSQDAKWWIDENGEVSVVPLTSYVPAPQITITPSTGLIGVPEQTQNGLSVRVLLNPTIKIGTVIKLDSTDINQLRFGLDISSVADNLTLQQGAAKLNADGLYYVMRADHSGDTRGTAWYTDLTCLSVDAENTPASAVAQTTVAFEDAIPLY